MLSFSGFSQWSQITTGFNDHFNDLHAENTSQITVAGNQGIYYSNNGGLIWTRHSMPANPSLNAVYDRCKFLQVVPDQNSEKVFLIGHDTIDNKPILASFSPANLEFVILYTGSTGSYLNGLEMFSQSLYAVGNSGLFIRHNLTSSVTSTIATPTTKNLRAVIINPMVLNSLYLAGDSVFFKVTATATTTTITNTYTIPATINKMEISNNEIFLLGPAGLYRSPNSAAPVLTPISNYHGGPLNGETLMDGNGKMFVATSHGIFRIYSNILEVSPSTSSFHVKGLSFIPFSNNGFACGLNGLILKTVNGGGATFPYLNVTINTKCKGDAIGISTPGAGSATGCQVIVFNQTLGQVVNASVGCGGLAMGFGFAGNFTLRYIASNGTFADTSDHSIFIPEPPTINLPVTLSDSILCKSEVLHINISSSQVNCLYTLKKHGDLASYGTAMGNGSTVVLSSVPLNQSGKYYLQTSLQPLNCIRNFTDTIKIIVENPKGRISSSLINGFIGEKIHFRALSEGAQSFQWQFDNSSTSPILSGQNVNTSFLSTGIKQVQLISSTFNGCIDTSSLKATQIVDENSLSDSCYNISVPAEDPPSNISGPTLHGQLKLVEDGFLLGGGAYNYVFPSQTGDSVPRTNYGGAYIGKYSRKGTLKWRWYSKNFTYNCLGCSFEEKPAIYGVDTTIGGGLVFAGNEHADAWMYFGKSDSIKIASSSLNSNGLKGIIAKTDSLGVILWRGVLAGGTIRKMKQDPFGNIWVYCTEVSFLRYEKAGSPSQILIPHDNLSSILRTAVLKFSPSGDFLHVMKVYFNGTNSFSAYDIEPDLNGNLWVTGDYLTSLTVHSSNSSNPTEIKQLRPGLNGSIFLLKYDSSGNLLFHINGSVIRFDAKSTGGAGGSSLQIDPSGNLYLLSSVRSMTTDDSLYYQHSNGALTKLGIGNFALSKFNSSGQHLWTNGSNPTGTFSTAHALGIKDSSVVVAFRIWLNNAPSWTGTFSSIEGSNYGFNLDQHSATVLEYTTSGVLKRAKRTYSQFNALINPKEISIDQHNNLYLAGETNAIPGSITPIPVFGQTINSEGNQAFVLKLNNNYCDVSTIPVAQAGPDKSVCSGSPVSLGSPSNFGNISWTSSPAGFISSEPSPIASPHVTTQYFLSAMNHTGVIMRDTVTVFVTGPVADGGPDKLKCGTVPVSLGNLTGNFTYSWSSNPTGFSANSAVVSVNPSVNTEYILTVSDGGSCVGRDTVLVKVGSVPLFDAGPDQTICATSSIQIGPSSNSTNYYTWSPVEGLFNAYITPTSASPDLTTKYFLTVRNQAGCKFTDSITINVFSTPTPTIISSGPTNFCTGSNVTLTSSSSSGNQWYFNGNLVPGATAQNLTVSQAGIYNVKSSQNNCFSEFSNSIQINLSPAPPVPSISITSGRTFLCPGDVIGFSSSTTGLLQNQWIKNGTPIPGATGTNYSTLVPGNFALQVSNGGCSVTSNVINVLAFPTPPTPIISAAQDSICQGDTLTLISSSTSGNTWIRDAQELATNWVNTWNATFMGAYQVSTTVNGCISQPSLPYYVTLLFPITPIITQNGPQLFSSVTSGNQWMFNGVDIPGAIGQSYTPQVSGSYSVRASIAFCSKTSSPFQYVITSLNNPDPLETLTIGPNPVKNKLVINSGCTSGKFQVNIFDIAGRKYLSVEISCGLSEIFMSYFPSGTYLVEVISPRINKKIQKLIIKL